MRFTFAYNREGIVTPPVTPETPPESGSDTLDFLGKPISQFTTTDVGTTVLIPYNDPTGKILLKNDDKNRSCIEFEVVGVNHHVTTEYPQTITLMTKNIIRGAAFDAIESNNPLFDEFFGSNARAVNGNNHWKYSNIRQWLNSSGKAGEWFTAQHEYDAAPTLDNIENNEENASYANDPGFLAGFSSEVIQHLTEITNITALPNIDNDYSSGGSETTIDKVFLPSYTEMGFGNNCEGDNEDGIAEGTALSKFTNNESRIKYPAEGKYWTKYWMRSPAINNSYSVRCVDPSSSGSHGEYDFYTACGSDLGPAPIIVLH